jgi:copper homeostasis protein (lipoprotein)
MMATKKQQQKRYNSIFLVIGILIVIGIIGFFFVKKNPMPTSSQAVSQTYTGEFPCADCSGIMTSLTLSKSSENSPEGTYVENEVYEGKSTKPIVTNGKWYLAQGTPADSKAFVLTLTQNNSSENTYYLIETGTKLTMLNQKKEKINSPFNESLIATSAKSAVPVQLSETESHILSQLPSWMPTATWSEPFTTQEQTFYGNFMGSEVTGKVTTKEASVPHFENADFLQSLGFTMDTNLSADGPGSSVWGYVKETNGKKQVVLFSYQTRPLSTNRDEPIQFTCPCQTDLTVFISH